MNALTGEGMIDAGDLEREIRARDRELANPYTKDLQVTAIHGAGSPGPTACSTRALAR